MVTTNEYSSLDPGTKRALIAEFEKPELSVDPFADKDPSFVGVLYGPAGGGKTVLAAKLGKLWGSIPDAKQTLIIDAEGSTESLRNHKKELRGFIDVKRFPGVREIGYLLPHWASSGQYKTVVIDSFTSMISAELKDILVKEGFSRSHKELYTQQDYGLALSRLIWMLEIAGRAEINLILTGHVNEPTAEEFTKGQLRRLHGSRNQAVEVTARVGNVFFVDSYWDDKEAKQIFTVQTRPDKKTHAKTRIAELSNTMTQGRFLREMDAWRLGIPFSEYKG